MDNRRDPRDRLFRLGALILAALLLTACGGGRVAPVEDLSDAPRNIPDRHRVSNGETLYSIAFLYGLDYRDIARWNGIRSPYLIRSGERLRLSGAAASPPPVKSIAKAPPKTATKPPVKTQPPKPSSKQAASSGTPQSASETKRPVYSERVTWGWPTKGPVIQSFSSRKAGRKGIDIAGSEGQSVVAAASGEVVYSGSGLERYYGRLVIIKHNDHYLSAYAHNQKLLVKEGQFVKGGERIALLGKSGTDRPKLHFEIRKDGKPVNPIGHLPKR